MDATVSVKAFGKAIKESLKAIPTKRHYGLPILANVRLETDHGGLWLTTTDLEWHISQYIPATVHEIGATTIPAKALSDIIAKLPKKDADGEAMTIRIHGNGNGEAKLLGPCDARLSTTDVDEYPPTPEPRQYATFACITKNLKACIESVAYCAADDDCRPILQSVLGEFSQSGLTLTAADGFRLGHVTVAAMCDCEGSFTIPANALSKMAKLIGKADTRCDVFVSPESVAFMFDDKLIQIRTVQGTFPNYRQLVPQSYTTRLLINRSDLLTVVQAAAVFAKDGSGIVRFEASERDLTVSAKTENLGNYSKALVCLSIDSKAEPEAIYISDNLPNDMSRIPPACIAFNQKYITACLSSWDTEIVAISFTDPSSPGVFVPVYWESTLANPSEWQVIMPMFVNLDKNEADPLPAFSDWGYDPRPLPCETCLYNPSRCGHRPNTRDANQIHCSKYASDREKIAEQTRQQQATECTGAPECDFCESPCNTDEESAEEVQTNMRKVKVSPRQGYPDGWDEREKTDLGHRLPRGAEFFSTPGHGYLLVNTKLLPAKVSEFDYQNGHMVLLEEDCSVAMWLAEMRIIPMDQPIKNMTESIPRVEVSREIDPDIFCDMLRENGQAIGTNGATYKLSKFAGASGDTPAVERWASCGKFYLIVGARGETFTTTEQAISWARFDQREPHDDTKL